MIRSTKGRHRHRRGPRRQGPRRGGSALLICVLAAAAIAVVSLAIGRMTTGLAMQQTAIIGTPTTPGLWQLDEQARIADTLGDSGLTPADLAVEMGVAESSLVATNFGGTR